MISWIAYSYLHELVGHWIILIATQRAGNHLFVCRDDIIGLMSRCSSGDCGIIWHSTCVRKSERYNR